jgi:hypothetical protein
MKYRKKPIVIDAIIWHNNFSEIFNFMNADDDLGVVGVDGDVLQIRTLEGIMNAQLGDYIIKGVKGEFYPCKPDIFEMTYELADTSSQTEISDEEIEKRATKYDNQVLSAEPYYHFVRGAKWYREQIKQRQ